MITRGENWLADLGYTAKIRPVLILSVPAKDDYRALITYVTRTTSARGTDYEVEHRQPGIKPGYFDAQGIGTTDHSRFIRKLATANAATLANVEAAVRAWLSL